mgnify:CR=1 FL=1
MTRCGLWQNRELTPSQLAWALANVEQDEVDAVEKEIRYYRTMVHIVHGSFERLSAFFRRQGEAALDPDFEAEMNTDLWWGEADFTKEVEWLWLRNEGR